ncbi:MAG: ABC transporter permease [Elusimicrobia bacterium]|nr:ABC transporter permease [Elusimicrobiota bacterium]
MSYFFDSLGKAFFLIFTLDGNILQISWTSLWITGTSVLIAAIFSMSLVFIISINQFKGRQILITIINTLTALPTVVIGLVVYSMLCRKGFLGGFNFLYTPYAMIIGQIILATPIITALVLSVMENADKKIYITAIALGATKFQSISTLAKELHIMILSAVIVGFGRVFSEVGISMMLGGNIKNYTRNITTAIAFETTKGEFILGLALGLILIIIALGINLLFQVFVKKSQ